MMVKAQSGYAGIHMKFTAMLASARITPAVRATALPVNPPRPAITTRAPITTWTQPHVGMLAARLVVFDHTAQLALASATIPWKIANAPPTINMTPANATQPVQPVRSVKLAAVVELRTGAPA